MSCPESLDNKKGKGRPKGSPNKTTQSIKEMIEAALNEVGGKDYMVTQAIENPSAFMQLIGKILPKETHKEIYKPELLELTDTIKAAEAIIRKVLTGDMTPDAAKQLLEIYQIKESITQKSSETTGTFSFIMDLAAPELDTE